MPAATRRRLVAAGLATVALPGVATVPAAIAPAASWPLRPVRILVGFPGGSTPDLAARLLGEAMAKAFRQPVIVDNRPGAAGNIAAELLARAGDDHTLGIVINGNLTTARLLNPKLGYDPAHDFSPISLVATAPLVLVATAGAPGGAAFFTAARAAGNRWNYGSVGIGSVGHLGMELIKSRANFDAVHVPYNGNPAVLNALIGGEVQMALVPPGLALPQARAGKLRAVGVTSGRSLLAPEVAPLAELGVAGADLEVWVALIGPAGLSAAAQQRLASEVPALVRGADLRQHLFDAGWQVQGSSPEALRLRVKNETAVLGAIIAARGIKAE